MCILLAGMTLVACGNRKAETEKVEPGTERLEPGTMEPGTMEPGTMEPGTMEPGTERSDSADMKRGMPPEPPRGDRPPRPKDGKFDGHRPPEPPEGFGGQRPPEPPEGEPDNMRGFDPRSEDDMEDNGMRRFMENNDDEGWE